MDKRKALELYLQNNIRRLTDETLEKVIREVEDEINESINKELKSAE